MITRIGGNMWAWRGACLKTWPPMSSAALYIAIRMIIDRVVSVIPAQAGTQTGVISVDVDPRLRGDDGHKLHESL
jgi:hypothetical protein